MSDIVLGEGEERSLNVEEGEGDMGERRGDSSGRLVGKRKSSETSLIGGDFLLLAML